LTPSAPPFDRRLVGRRAAAGSERVFSEFDRLGGRARQISMTTARGLLIKNRRWRGARAALGWACEKAQIRGRNRARPGLGRHRIQRKPRQDAWDVRHWLYRPTARTPPEEVRSMNEAEFQKRLAELVAEIDNLPAGERDRLRKLAEETKDRHEQIKKSVSTLQESIDFLRLGIKYMLFDLEATRRENSYLRKMLEQDPSGGGNDTPQ
jgi:hypothetical protein